MRVCTEQILYVQSLCIYVGPHRKRKVVIEQEEEDDERVAVIDTGMFSVKVRIYTYIRMYVKNVLCHAYVCMLHCMLIY